MINIPSKSDKQASQLRDCLRILAWQAYKVEKKVSGLQAYEAFGVEWNDHEVQKLDLKGLQKFIKELGYTDAEMLEIRSEYYDKRGQTNGTETAVSPVVEDHLPY